MGKTKTPPNTERKKAGNGVDTWVHNLLMTRRVLLLAMQVLHGIVKLMQAIKDVLGNP
jgi:hypothetical protein